MVETSEFSAALDEVYLKRGWSPPDTPSTTSALQQAKAALKAAGKTIVDLACPDFTPNEARLAFCTEIQAALEAIRKAEER